MVEEPVGSAKTGVFTARKHVNNPTMITSIVVFMKALLLLEKRR
jgi:hypothetical protein